MTARRPPLQSAVLRQALIKLGDWYQLAEVTDREWQDRRLKILLLEPLPRNEYIIGPQHDAGKPIRMARSEEIICWFDGHSNLNGLAIFAGELPAQWAIFRCVR